MGFAVKIGKLLPGQNDDKTKYKTNIILLGQGY